MKVWNDYTIEQAIVIIEKKKKNIKANRFKIAYFCWRNLGPDVVQDFIWFTTELITEIMQDIMNMVKKKKE